MTIVRTINGKLPSNGTVEITNEDLNAYTKEEVNDLVKQKKYLTAGRVNTDQTISAVNTDVIFNRAYNSSGITINNATGAITIPKNTTCIIIAEILVSFNTPQSYIHFGLYSKTDGIFHNNQRLVINSPTSTYTEANIASLSFILPSHDTDREFSIRSAQQLEGANITYNVRFNKSRLVVYEL